MAVTLNPKAFKNNTFHIQATCRDCKNTSFLDQNKTNDEWVMPFGKYKGYTITEIAEEDARYCQWAAENIDDEKIRERFEAVL